MTNINKEKPKAYKPETKTEGAQLLRVHDWGKKNYIYYEIDEIDEPIDEPILSEEDRENRTADESHTGTYWCLFGGVKDEGRYDLIDCSDLNELLRQAKKRGISKKQISINDFR